MKLKTNNLVTGGKVITQKITKESLRAEIIQIKK